MFVIGYFFSGLAQVLDAVITILWWLILIRALISWVNPDPYNTLVMFLNRITEPLLRPFRRLIPMERIGIDLSPLLAMLFLMFARAFLVHSLFGIAYRLQ
jgi:YggT family protein